MSPKLPIGHSRDMLTRLFDTFDDLVAAGGSQILSIHQFIPLALPTNPAWWRSENTRLRQLEVKLHPRLICKLLKATETTIVSAYQSAAKVFEVHICCTGQFVEYFPIYFRHQCILCQLASLESDG